ncbi:MAG: hypothetical protein NW207_05645 [Cytophagales bacterium]|nr:hypothetical protein [Cytophagales bacterium]
MMNKIILPLLLISSICYSQNISNVGERYDRSSLSIILLDVNSRQYASEIRNVFLKQPIPEKYNDHSIPLRYIPVKDNPADESNLGKYLENYLNNAQAGKMMVAKWFQRDENGFLNMNLISQRGLYNATDLDVKSALASKTGMAKIQDAGEKLINKSYIAVYSFKIINKENAAKATGAGLKLLGAVMQAAGNEDGGNIADAAGTVAENVRGFTCIIDVYLFKLNWSPEVSATFYESMWNDASSPDIAKAYAFENSTMFSVNYISKSRATSDVTGLTVDGKANEDRIADLMVKTMPKGLAALEGGTTTLASGEVVEGGGLSEFKTSTKLDKVDPYRAKIGLKEGLKKNDLYLAYEKSDNNSNVSFKPIAAFRVKGNKIWDNRYNADGKADDAQQTQFYKVYGKKPYPGVILVQKRQNPAYWSFYGGGLTRDLILGSHLEFGHRLRFGFGLSYILDRVSIVYSGEPSYYSVEDASINNILPYLTLAHTLILTRSFYIEPDIHLGWLKTNISEYKIFVYNVDNSLITETDITEFLSESELASSSTIYAEPGMKLGLGITPSGASIFAKVSYNNFLKYNHLFDGTEYDLDVPGIETSGFTPINLTFGIRTKL